jgi:FkbM family methyltransferase
MHVKFIQVGSNVGVMETDFVSNLVFEEGWEGVLIEPVPWLFTKLKANYAGCNGLHFENVAISDKREVRDLYVVNPEKVKRGDDGSYVGAQWGSFTLDHVKKCPLDLPDDHFTSLKVQCVTIADIVKKYQLEETALLHIDAEGAEAIILHSIDFHRWKPKMIVFEHVHMGPDTYFTLIQHLGVEGYDVLATEVLDTVLALRE